VTQPQFRRVQKGNPYQLVIDQHIHAAHCIKKFSNADGKVSVFDKSISRWISSKPSAAIFCAKRAWDQRAEKGYMNKIETNFFNVINSLSRPFNERDHDAITRYFHLWRLRGEARDKESKPIHFNGLSGSALTLDQQECIENNHALFILEKEGIPHHLVNGFEIQRKLDYIYHSMDSIKWGLLTAVEGEFLVADYYPHDKEGFIPFLPISPKHVLFANSKDKTVDSNLVRHCNMTTISAAKKYYFCKDIGLCIV
jgi:hypothetical protein